MHFQETSEDCTDCIVFLLPCTQIHPRARQLLTDIQLTPSALSPLPSPITAPLLQRLNARRPPSAYQLFLLLPGLCLARLQFYDLLKRMGGCKTNVDLSLTLPRSIQPKLHNNLIQSSTPFHCPLMKVTRSLILSNTILLVLE